MRRQSALLRSRAQQVIAVATVAGILLAGCGGASPSQKNTTTPRPGAPTPFSSPPRLGTTTITFVSNPVHRGAKATFRALAVPRAECVLTINNSSGGSVDTAGVAPATTDAQGVATWAWTVPLDIASGTYAVSVVCTPGARSRTHFEVT